MTILSCKTIFGLTFSAISENLLECFFSQSPKNCDFGHFLARLAKIGQNENFYQKSCRAIFYPYCPPTNFMPSFRKIVGAVSEINLFHPSIHPNKGDITEPVASLVQQVSRMNIERAPFGFRWKFGEEKCLEKKCWEQKFLDTLTTLTGHIGHFGQIWHHSALDEILEKKNMEKNWDKNCRPHCPDW